MNGGLRNAVFESQGVELFGVFSPYGLVGVHLQKRDDNARALRDLQVSYFHILCCLSGHFNHGSVQTKRLH